ncbi:MAG: hypothetical protein R3F43_02970 [bacterium]
MLLEQATQRQAAGTADERGTLEQTCGELQQELRDVRDQLAGADAEREVREATIADLESAVQRGGLARPGAGARARGADGQLAAASGSRPRRRAAPGRRAAGPPRGSRGRPEPHPRHPPGGHPPRSPR